MRHMQRAEELQRLVAGQQEQLKTVQSSLAQATTSSDSPNLGARLQQCQALQQNMQQRVRLASTTPCPVL